MSPPLSASVRQSVWFSFESGKDDKHTLDRTGLSVRQVRKMRRNWEMFGEVVKPKLGAGRPKKICQLHNQALLEYLEERPTVYRDEMAWFLWDEFDLIVDESTISRALKQLGWNRKKAVRIAKQRNQILRNDWMARLAGWRADQLVFLDESAACERTGRVILCLTDIHSNHKNRRSPLWLGTKRNKTYSYSRAKKMSEMEYPTSFHN